MITIYPGPSKLHSVLSPRSGEVDPDFECTLEVYCHRQCEDFTIASTPRRIKKKFNEISDSIGRSMGKRLSGLVSAGKITHCSFVMLYVVHDSKNHLDIEKIFLCFGT